MPLDPIPLIDFGGDGPDLLFLHANGYPPACYRPLISRLAKTNHLIAMPQRPLWKDSRPEDLHDWMQLADDLIRFLDEQGRITPITVIGHSMGGISALRAAMRQPDRFHRLVLLDPVLLPPYFILIWNIALKFKFAHLLHPHISTAANRRREFDDLDRLFKSYRRHSGFRYMSDEALRTYIEGITCPTADGAYRLCYSPEWEAQVYYASIWHDMDLWRNLKHLKPPTMIIRGAETDTFFESTARKVHRINPAIRIETVERATHLVALERPQEVEQLIHEYLTSSAKP